MCLHVNSECSKRRDIALDVVLKVRALVVEHHVDLVAVEFKRLVLATPRARQHRCACFWQAPSPLWALGEGPKESGWTAAGSRSLARTMSRSFKTDGALEHDRTALGLSAVDQTCHFQTCLRLDKKLSWRCSSRVYNVSTCGTDKRRHPLMDVTTERVPEEVCTCFTAFPFRELPAAAFSPSAVRTPSAFLEVEFAVFSST